MIFLILLFAVALRLISLDQSLWLDEATSVLVARDFSLQKIITEFSIGDFHPPLFYLLLKLWILLFGSTEVGVRMLSVVIGVATVYLIYLLCSKINKNVAYSASLLLATAPLHIYYSQEARMYVLETFFAALVVLRFVNFLQYDNLRNRLYLAGSIALLLYTDYLPVFLVIGLGVYILVYKRERLKGFLITSFLSLVLYAPWLPTFFAQLNSGLLVKSELPGWWSVLGQTNFKQIALVPIKFLLGRISFDNNMHYVAAVLSATLVYTIPFYRALVFGKQNIYWFWLVVPIILSATLGLGLSVFSYFRLIFVLPAFYVLAAIGVNSIPLRAQGFVVSILVLVNLLATFAYLLSPVHYREDWRGAVAHIEQNSTENSSTIFVTDGQRDPYYYYSSTASFAYAKQVPSYGPKGIEHNSGRIWLMRYVQPIFDPEDKLRQSIEDLGYKKIAEKDFNGVVVWEYAK